MNDLTFEFGNPSQYQQEVAKSQVADLAPPYALHPFEVEGFKEKVIVFIGQLVSQLEKPITTFVSDTLVNSSHVQSSPIPRLGAFGLTTQDTLRFSKLVRMSFEKLRRLDDLTIGRNKECFQAKVESRAFTRRGFGWLDFLFNRKAKPQVAEVVPLDCNRLYLAFNLAVFNELVHLAAKFDLVTFKQFPACLFQREGLIPLNFLEFRRVGFDVALQVLEKQFIACLNTLYDVLNSLSVNQLPERILRTLFKSGNMFLEEILRKMATILGVVSLVKANTVIVNNTRYINLLIDAFGLLTTIQSEFKRLGYDQLSILLAWLSGVLASLKQRFVIYQAPERVALADSMRPYLAENLLLVSYKYCTAIRNTCQIIKWRLSPFAQQLKHVSSLKVFRPRMQKYEHNKGN